MIHSTDTQPPAALLKELSTLKIQSPPAGSCQSSPFAGKCVAVAGGSPEPFEPESSTSAVALAQRSVESGFASDPLPATQPGDIVNWGELHQKIRETLTFEDVIQFSVYMDIPLNKFIASHQEFRSDSTGPFRLMERLVIEENCKITHEQLLLLLANSSSPSLVTWHCQTSGIAVDQSQFLSDWPACVMAADNDAALNHKLDIFKLDKIFQKEKTVFFYDIPATTLAYAAGYPELMDDPHIKQCSRAANPFVNKVLLKKILDKHGGSITTNEIVKIMSNPEIMRISSAYQLIESLKGNTGPYFRLGNIRDWGFRLRNLALEVAKLGVNAEHFGRSLGVPLHIIQKIFARHRNSKSMDEQFEDLLKQATRCSPRLTPGHIMHTLNKVEKLADCGKELDKYIEKDSKLSAYYAHLPRLKEFPPEELPKPEPLYRPEDDHSTGIASSQPLTLDFLRQLPLSHNWFLIGVTMGLSGDELKSITTRVTEDGRPTRRLLSLAAPVLSGILVQKGLETGHLHQALELLNDQATLPYFPEHLAGQPEQALPEKIAKAYKQGQLTARIVSALGSKNIRFLSDMIQTGATSGDTFKSLKRPSTDNPPAGSAPPKVAKAEPSTVTANNNTPIPDRSVISCSECSRLSETQLDATVYWGDLDDKIIRGVSPKEQILFAIYLGFPTADIANIAKTVRQRLSAPDNYLSLPAPEDGSIREELKITHKKLLTMLAGISAFNLVELHCNNFGIVFELSRFLIQWPPALKTADAALDYQLDFFKLHKVFKQDNYLLNKVPMAAIAYAAGYPELMMDQDLQTIPIDVAQLSPMFLLKRILDKQGGVLTTKELLKIMSHPEIMALSSAHRLIEALIRGYQIPVDQINEGNVCRQMFCLAKGIATIKIPADAIGHGLGVSLPIIQSILKRSFDDEFDDEACRMQIYDLLIAATHCQPGLTPPHILNALRKVAKFRHQVKELDDFIAINKKKLSLFQDLIPEQPPTVEPLYRQDDDNAVAMADSTPLTPDFLRRLPLSHNWFSIGLAMGLCVDELRDIHQKTSQKKDSLAACYLSNKLAELGKRGLETGHLFQVLNDLDDQVALHYFPNHLSAAPEKALPEDTADAMEQAKGILELLNTVDQDELTKILSGYDRYMKPKF